MKHMNQNSGKFGRQPQRKLTENMSGMLSQCQLSLLFDGFQVSTVSKSLQYSKFLSVLVVSFQPLSPVLGCSSWPSSFFPVVTHLEQAGFEARRLVVERGMKPNEDANGFVLGT